MDALVRQWTMIALEEARRSERVRADAPLPETSPTSQTSQPSLAARLGKAAADAWTKLTAERAPTPSGFDASTPLPDPAVQ
jgi:hypothetical protein